MTLMLTPEARKKLVTFMVRKSLSSPDTPKDENQEGSGDEPDEIPGGLFAAEKMMKAISSNDAKLFNSALGEWFDMRPSEGSEAHEDSKPDDDEGAAM